MSTHGEMNLQKSGAAPTCNLKDCSCFVLFRDSKREGLHAGYRVRSPGNRIHARPGWAAAKGHFEAKASGNSRRVGRTSPAADAREDRTALRRTRQAQEGVARS